MENNKYIILLVDDDDDIIEFLSYNLKKEGYQIYSANTGPQAIAIARKVIPHLILLDIMMPDMDGIETCKEIRAIDELNHVIIAFLTARNESYSEIIGFQSGADDYITKPIKIRVLISRLSALLRRNRVVDVVNPIIKIGSLSLDSEKYQLFIDGKEIVLAKKEFELIKLLASKPGKLFYRDDIFHTIWGDDSFIGKRTIDVHIRKLREKMGDKYIKTVKGVGYKIEA